MIHFPQDAVDSHIHALIQAETDRQESELTLIASENYTPSSIRSVGNSILTNKYAEGYPGKRYYAGCRFADEIESLAIERAKTLFGAEHANVQPHSGSQANMALYATLLKPGDTIMGMSLAAGGHLTHGHSVNFSGQFYKSVQYGVDSQTELLDYNEIETLAHQHKPKLIIAGASAYSRIIDFERIKKIADSIEANFAADIAHIAGLIAAGLHPSPIPYADCVSSTTHKTLRGPRGGFLLSKKQHSQAMDRSILPGVQGGPLMHVIAAKAIAFKQAQSPEFIEYQKQVIKNAQVMAQAFGDRGYRIVAGGTDNHLFIIDLQKQAITGLAAQTALEQAGIAVSRSCIPNEPQKPWVTSGIRLGTPAMTTRGMKEPEVLIIVDFIDYILKNKDSEPAAQKIKDEVARLCSQFPMSVV